MKRICPILFGIIVSVYLSVMVVFAASSGTCGNGVTWSLDDAGILTITGNGDITSAASWEAPAIRSAIKEVNILEGVTGINGEIFKGCSNLTKVSVPKTVSSVGEAVFMECPKLAEINVDADNPDLCSINGVIFNKAVWKLEVYPAGKSGTYTIPSTVTAIENLAFVDTKNLTEISLPANLKSIGHHAFYRSGLTSVTIPSGISSLAMAAFEQCKDLKKVVISEGMETIEDDAFWGCSSLTVITLPTSLTSISEYAFDQSALTTVYCSPGSYAATWAQNHGYIAVDKDKPGDDTPVPAQPDNVINAGDTKEYKGSIKLRGSLITTAFIPSSSDSSVATATAARTGNIVYSDGVQYYFSVWVKGVASGTVTITLYTDTSKTTSLWSKTVTIVGGDSGSNTPGEQPGRQSEDPSPASDSGSDVTAGNCKFIISGSAATLHSPKSKNLTKITIPAAVKVNGKSVPVTSIAPNAFKGMKSLTSVTIGKNIKKIGKNAFNGCKKLKKITIKTTKLTAKAVGANAFKGINKKAAFKCPKAKKAAYKKILLKKGAKKTMSFK